MPEQEYREEVLNITLARLLTNQGVVTAPETITHLAEGQRRMPDVLVEYQGLRTIIEGKFDDNPRAKRDVHDQAYSRITEGISHISLALLYPRSIRKADSMQHLADLIYSCFLQVQVVSEAGSEGWVKCQVKDIGDLLRRVFEQLVRQDIVKETAAKLEAGVSEFARHTISNGYVIERFTSILGIGEVPESDSKTRKMLELKRRESAAKIAGLSILNAMIFQDVLSQKDIRVNPIRKFLVSDSIIDEFINHWFFIVKSINYQPIFQIAADLLSTIPASRNTSKAVRFLGERAIDVLTKRAAMRHDLMGRVYHTLLADKKFLGTYFTSVQAATLLLKIALDPQKWKMNWSDISVLNGFRIADLACGTGTLLMAAAEAITDNYIHRCYDANQELNLVASHKILMEEIIYGYDVLPSALHLTASTLALRSSEVMFRSTNLYSLPLGGEDHRLGSIEFLLGKQVSISTNLFGIGSKQVTGEGDKLVKDGQPIAPLPALDLCVINPPFTRSVGGNKLFGSSPDGERSEMQNRLSRLLRDKNIEASSTAGLGAVFVAIADIVLKVGGRIALVLPKTILSGISWKKTRDMLAKRYVVEVIIVSHDPLKWNFSDNTDLSEVLIVARKSGVNNNNSKDHRVKCINLWKNPETVFPTLMCAKQINEEDAPDIEKGQGALNLEVGETEYGEVVSISWNELKDQSWIQPFSFAQHDLLKFGYFISKGKIYIPGYGVKWEIPVIKLGCLGNLGPDRRDIHDGFKFTKSKTQYPAYWDNKSEYCNKILQNPNRYLSPLSKPKPGRNLRNVELLWPRSGNIVIAERLGMISHRLSSLYFNQKVLSNVWWPFDAEKLSEIKKRSLVLWLNSTMGLISMLSVRGETHGAWIDFKKPNLEAMQVFNVNSLSEEQGSTLDNVFNEVSEESLLTFPEMSHDPVRAKIDEAFSKVMDLPDLSGIRMLLSQEPVICLKPLYSA